jgi:hypothetical protein
MNFQNLQGESMRRNMLIGALMISALTASAAAIAQQPPGTDRPEARSGGQAQVDAHAEAVRAQIRREEAARTAKQMAEQMRYHGIKVDPDREAKGAALAAQKRIAAILTQFDYVPDQRVAHFRYFADNGWEIINGWSARIVEATPIAGGMRVTLWVWPTFANSGLSTSDHTVEQYLINNDQFRFIGFLATPGPKVSTVN